ncbi:MAG TPA: hypothetical protein VGL72_09295, partial [Bryobacteraceae bacterium]
MFVPVSGASAATNLLGLQFGGSYSRSAPDMEAVARSGAHYWRLNFSCDTKAWSDHEHELELAWKHGLTVIADLVQGCGSARGFPKYESGSAEWAAWQTYLWELVQHFGRGEGREQNGEFWNGKANPTPITIWEIGNEENLGNNNPSGVANGKTYGEWMRRSASALREAQNGSPITVLMGGLITVANGGGNLGVGAFLREVAEVPETGTAFDGLSLHPYGFGANSTGKIENNIQEGRNKLTEFFSANKQIWITEIGWGVSPESPEETNFERVSPEEQENDLNTIFSWVENHQAPVSQGGLNISSLLYYFYRDVNWDGKWDSFAGLRKDGSHSFTEPNFRPAWYAYQEHSGVPRWPVSPGVSTEAATAIGAEGATIGYAVEPHGLPTHYQLEWGTTTAYGSTVALPEQWEDRRIPGSQIIGGLLPGLAYHYRVVATNENAEVSATPDRTFLSNPKPAPVQLSNGTVNTYFRGSDGRLHWWEWSNGWVQQWVGAEGSVTSNPKPILTSGGTVDTYFRGSDGRLHWWEWSNG